MGVIQGIIYTGFIWGSIKGLGLKVQGLNSLKGVVKGIIQGSILGVFKGDTRSADNGSCTSNEDALPDSRLFCLDNMRKEEGRTKPALVLNTTPIADLCATFRSCSIDRLGGPVTLGIYVLWR